MYTDAQLRLSAAQALTSGTIVSTNTIDLLSTGRDVGRGQDLRLQVNADVAFVGGTSVTVQLIESANANLSSPVVLASGPTLATAALVAGAELADLVVPGTSRRYLGVQYVIVGTYTAGTVTANIVSDTDGNNYPPANTGY